MKFGDASKLSWGYAEPDVRGVAPGEQIHQRWRQRVVGILLIADVIATILVIIHVHGPAGIVAGLLQSLVIPGWSIIGRLRLESVAMEVALTLATSAALVMMLAQLLVTLGWWHLWLAQILWGVLFGAILASQTPLGRSRRATRKTTT